MVILLLETWNSFYSYEPDRWNLETFSRGNLSAYIPFPYLSLYLMINSSSFITEKNVQKGTSEPWKNNEAQSKVASVILMEVLMGPWGVLLGLWTLVVAMNKAIKVDRCLGPLWGLQ